MPTDLSPGATALESDLAETVPPECDPVAPDDAWIAAHYERIHRAAWLMTGDAWEAEDLAQETFVVAIDRWRSFGGRSSRLTWLYGILIRLRRRRARSVTRLRRRIEEYMSRKERTVAADPQLEFAYRQWRESVWADVATLPAAQREAILLRFAEGMTYEQIAQTSGCAVGTAKTRVHHGLSRLRNHRDRDNLAPPDVGSLRWSTSEE